MTTVLTPAALERYSLIAEEAAEVIQAITKIFRHGEDSYHPSTYENNLDTLLKEITDLKVAIELFEAALDFNKDKIEYYRKKKIKNLKKYLHFIQNFSICETLLEKE